MKQATTYTPATRLAVHRFSAPPAKNHQVSVLQDEIERLRRIIARQNTTIEGLAESASRCALTGALNRRALMESLAAALNDHQRYGHRGAVLLLDLNKFKPINDTYGHAAGDAMLQHVVGILSQNTRESDLVARTGGDEFVVILKETTNAEAVAKARQLAALLRGTPLQYAGLTLETSASIGVASFAEATDADELLKLADSRMYLAKNGRANLPLGRA